MMEYKVTEVVAALLQEHGRFLVFQRPAEKARGLLWEFVGGKTEPGETPEQALIRECREELGIRITVGEVFMDVTHRYPDLTVHLTVFYAAIAPDSPDLRLLEHRAMCRADLETLKTLPFCPADQPVLEKIEAVYGD